MALVYLDTSAWNWLCDSQRGRSRRRLGEHTYLFSSANLDEFLLAGPGRSAELAKFAWTISNREKLYDHAELSALEIGAFQRQNHLRTNIYDRTDRNFHKAWTLLRHREYDPRLGELVSRQLTAAKVQYRDWLRVENRDRFRPLFKRFSKSGLERRWHDHIAEIAEERLATEMVRKMIEYFRLDHLVEDIDRLPNLPSPHLPCTSCWLEYYLALPFIAAVDVQPAVKPDLGDQVDFRHAAYAGLSDVYLTRDPGMKVILERYVSFRKARILTPEEWVEQCRELTP